MISYAQNREDVVLNRAFPGPAGFYIDVGAADPVYDSVTKWFSDRGWSGVNVEPQSQNHAALVAARPRDVNLRAGVSDRSGTLTLFEAPARHGWATMEPDVADRFRADGIDVVPHDVPVLTLADVCERHAPGAIDFLKVDVEGHEAHVLRGADFGRFRPRVVVVEATEVGRPTPNHAAWEPGLLAAGYHFALFDGLNRFYARDEDRHLLPVLRVPANVFDQYVPFDRVSAEVTMDLAFYNEAGRPTVLGAAPALARRVLRRVLRPIFFRLRDALQFLHDRGLEDRAWANAAAREAAALAVKADALAGEVAELRGLLSAAHQRLAELERRTLADLSALDGRVAGTEDDLMRALAASEA